MTTRMRSAEKAAKKHLAQAATKKKNSLPKLSPSARVPQFQQSNHQVPWVPRGKTAPPVVLGRSPGPRPLGPCFKWGICRMLAQRWLLVSF